MTSFHLTPPSDILGLGFRCGFLGLLHMEVFSQRLKQEYGADVISTAPSVTYRGPTPLNHSVSTQLT